MISWIATLEWNWCGEEQLLCLSFQNKVIVYLAYCLILGYNLVGFVG